MKYSIFTGLLAATLGLGGCANSPAGSETVVVGGRLAPAPRPDQKYREFEYGWRDDAFYQDWYDRAAIVLPPPAGGAVRRGMTAAPAQADSGELREVVFGAGGEGK